MATKKRWVDYIVEAMEDLGGFATYDKLYQRLEEIRDEPFTKRWQATVRRTIEDHSSDSGNFRGRDVFYSIEGIGNGVWGLRDTTKSSQIASDFNVDSIRLETTTYRLIRDTSISRYIKWLYQSKCQICDFSFQLPNGNFYSEAHHIKPLGKPHNGPDISSNILSLCPNHHAMLDYGVIPISKSNLTIHQDHLVDEELINYHNECIFQK